MAYVYAHHMQYMLLFLVPAVNPNRFEVTPCYSSCRSLCALVPSYKKKHHLFVIVAIVTSFVLCIQYQLNFCLG